MSSHHIVREAQEPALLVWQIGATAGEQLLQLLEWSPTVVVKEEVFEAVLALGIKVDAVICTPEKAAEAREKADAQLHIQLIPSATAENMLKTALQHLAAQGQQAVNVFTTEASALDKLLPALASQDFLPNVVVLSKRERWSLYRSGRFAKWLPEGEEIRVQAAAPGIKLSSTGFAGTQKEAPGAHLLDLRTEKSGHTSIRAEGPFWVAEKLN